MTLCIFNPEHDLCLAKGRAHYVPPRSAVEFARRDAGLMQTLYPGAVCCSVYDIDYLKSEIRNLDCPTSSNVNYQISFFNSIVAWGWDAVVKHELLKRGAPATLLPSDEELATIRELQHRSTVLPLQPDCREVHSIEEMEALLKERTHWVMKAPWSGAGRGLRWIHGSLSDIDRRWLLKTVGSQRCVIAEPRRDTVADVAIEYRLPDTDFRVSNNGFPVFLGYSYFKTGSGVYKENYIWTDDEIANHFSHTDLQTARERVERWLQESVQPRYHGPLGVDLMVCSDGSVHIAEVNLRHTMGMIAHAKIQMS